MFKYPQPRQHTLETTILEGLAPKYHLLRKIDNYIDFLNSFAIKSAICIATTTATRWLILCCCLKMLFIDYLFGAHSERQLVREVQVNITYRCFFGLSLTDKIIDASYSQSTMPPSVFGKRAVLRMPNNYTGIVMRVIADCVGQRAVFIGSGVPEYEEDSAVFAGANF